MSVYNFLLVFLLSGFAFAQTEAVNQTQTSTESIEQKIEADKKAEDELKNYVTNTDPDSQSSGSGRYRVHLFSLGGIDRTQIENMNDRQQSMYFFENYLQLAYKFRKDARMALRYSFNYSTAGYDRTGKDLTDKADTRDMSILLTYYDVFEDYLPASVSYSFQPRLYLPTSEKSKMQGMISALRLENVVKYYVGRYDYFRFWVAPTYYFQRSTAYVDSNNKIKTTDMMGVKHGASYSYNINKFFSLAPGFEFEDEWSNTSEVNNRDEFRNTTVDYRLGLEMRPMKRLMFTLGYGHRKDLIKTDNFNDTFTLMTNLALY